MPSIPGYTEPSPRAAEVVIYLVFSPKYGPEHRIFTEEDVQALGGVHAIERLLEDESYWFVRLGLVTGKETASGVTVRTPDIARLSVPCETSWRTGRQNPGFSGTELERQAYRAAFQCVGRMLVGWKQEEDGIVEAYALKALKMNPRRLGSLIRGLQNLEKVHEIVEIIAMKYWYDPSWPEPHMPDELVEAEYSLNIPLQFRRAVGHELISVHVMHLASC